MTIRLPLRASCSTPSGHVTTLQPITFPRPSVHNLDPIWLLVDPDLGLIPGPKPGPVFGSRSKMCSDVISVSQQVQNSDH